MTECYRSQKHGQVYRKLSGKLHGHNVITQVDVYGRPSGFGQWRIFLAPIVTKIWYSPVVTLTFDLLTPKSNQTCLCIKIHL